MDHPLLKGGELIVSVVCLELSIDGRRAFQHSNGGFLVGGWLFWTAFWCCTKCSKILGTTTFKDKSSLEVTWKHSKMRPKMGWYPNSASFPQPSVRSQSFTSLQIDVPRMVELNSSKGMSQLARKVMKIILQSWTSVEGCKVPGNHTRYKSWMDIDLFFWGGDVWRWAMKQIFEVLHVFVRKTVAIRRRMMIL